MGVCWCLNMGTKMFALQKVDPPKASKSNAGSKLPDSDFQGIEQKVDTGRWLVLT